ncbi:MAG: glucosaminidase domain-containing protein [Bacteroidota bacterium]
MKTSCCHSHQIIAATDGASLCGNPVCNHYLSPTDPIQAPRTWNRLFIAFFFVFSFMLTLEDFSNTSPEAEITQNVVKNLEKTRELTSDHLRDEIGKQHLICPDQVYAQMMLESGHLGSYLTKKANNLLGMRYPYKRTTTAIGLFLPEKNQIVIGDQASLMKYHNQNHYAVYASWQDCVKDYKNWQDECFRLTDRYLAFLGNYYAEDQQYVEKIRSISQK